MTRKIILLCFLLSLCIKTVTFSESWYWEFPYLPPPESYGNILINRVSEGAGVRPVGFSHWSHRIKFTCKACHTELGFSFKTNTTEITEAANRAGMYCGACHNGRITFDYTEENCDKCHSGNKDYGKEKFSSLSGFPWAEYGNEIDWVKALEEGMIMPNTYFLEEGRIMPNTYFTDEAAPKKFKRIAPPGKMVITAKWRYIYSHAEFSHEIHGKWLDCLNCHPGIFNEMRHMPREGIIPLPRLPEMSS